MGTQIDFETAKALLAWQVELGATEAIGDVPIDRYALPVAPKVAAGAARPNGARDTTSVLPVAPAQDPVSVATASAQVDSLAALRAALAAFDLCELKKGAQNLVFADGVPGARVMVIGEAPGRDEDAQGVPFVGRAGQLLDAMLGAIDLGRDRNIENAVYITNILPWRPPQNRDPKPDEIAMMLPFLKRHVDLAQPEMIIAMGNISCQALLGRKGITRLRGTWVEALGLPCLPMFHPAYLLRNPLAKRETWADLIAVRHRLAAG